MIRHFVSWSLALGVSAAALAQTNHSGPVVAPPARAQDLNTISITPVEGAEPQPITPVTIEPLDDVSPDKMTEAYIDGVFAGAIAAGRVPGAAVVIMRNGEIVLSKGYGFANIPKRTPIDPKSTRFRVASISKLFTALAVMQQVEAGRLTLNSDVNARLKQFKIVPAGSGTVTIKSLLDHTSGFDDKFQNLATPLGKPRQDLAAYLAGAVPRTVFAPGKVFNYSNYGYALAGHVAAQAAGSSFDRLMADQFFGPLQMKTSSFGIQDGMAGSMATPYGRTPLGLTELRLGQVVPAPAGDLVTTAEDLSKFMTALANEGAGLVAPETFQLMLQPQTPPGATGDSWGLGFALGEANGVKWFGHGGAWPGFAAELRMNAETKSGFLILLNTDNAFDIVQPLVNAVTDRIWPDTTPRTAVDMAAAARAAMVLTGTFIPARRARSDFSLLGASMAAIRLSEGPNGNLFGAMGANVPQRLVFEPLRDGVWIERTYRWRLSGYRGQGGARDGVLLGPFVFERAGFADDLASQTPWVVAAAVVMLVTLAAWIMGAFNRRMFGEPMAAVRFWPRLWGAASAALGLAFLSGLAVVASTLSDLDVLEGALGALTVIQTLTVLLVPLALGVAVFAALGFGPGLRARLAQGWFAILTVSLFFVLWFAWTWNLHIFAR